MAPILASHALDVQSFPIVGTDVFSKLAHVGSPGINVETKVIEVDDAAIEAGADPMGMLVVQGPPVGKIIGGGEVETGWLNTGDRAKVFTNGSFKVV
jgi:long-chain acyl-CoA synthetase